MLENYEPQKITGESQEWQKSDLFQKTAEEIQPLSLEQQILTELKQLSLEQKETLKAASLNILQQTPTVHLNILYEKLAQQLKLPDLSTTPQPLTSAQEILQIQSELLGLDTSQESLLNPSLVGTIDTLLSPEEYNLYKTLCTYHVLTTPSVESQERSLPDLYTSFIKLKNEYFPKKYGKSRAMRNLNPGNIKTKGDKGQDKDNYAIYSSLEHGRKVLLDRINGWKKQELPTDPKKKKPLYHSEMNLVNFFKIYASQEGWRAYAIKAAKIINAVHLTRGITALHSSTIPLKAIDPLRVFYFMNQKWKQEWYLDGEKLNALMKKFGIITTKDIPELQFIAEKLRKSFISPFTTPIKEVDTLAFSIAIATKEDGYCYNALKDEGFIK